MNADRMLLWLIFAVAVAALAFAYYSERSSAAFTFNSSPASGGGLPSFDLNKLNLPQPLVEFINGFRGVGEGVSHAQAPSYPAANTYTNGVLRWLDNFFRSIPLVSQLYSIFVRIVTLVGHLLIWILQLLIDLITKGLSFLR